MTQPDLFVEAPWQRHSATSLAAAEAIQPRLNGLQQSVMRTIRAASKHASFNGATDEEIGDWLGLGGNTVRPRRRELQLAGLIRDSGRTRATASGRQAVVWVAK